jgi:hypothetical protein
MVNGLMPHRKVGQLMSILTNVDFLATCYKNIKRKRGAMTPASLIPLKQQKTNKGDQKNYIKATKFAPDRMSPRIFRLTSHLLKEGRYPWGISRRIYIPKPGTTDALRPITYYYTPFHG